MRYRPGVKRSYIYIQAGVGGRKKTAIAMKETERDESTEEQMQCKKQYICTPHGTLSPPSPAMAMWPLHRIHARNNTETSHANMRYAKSLTPSPTVATKEEEFFSQGIWEDMSRSLLGVDTLRSRLSKVLLGQIAAELPSLIDEIDIKSSACRNRLDKLGDPRATLTEQQLYLFQLSQSFQSLVKAAVDGTYNDPFFGDAKSELGYQKRIRAVMQNVNLDFADNISRRGHCRKVTESKNTNRISKDVIPITRDKFIDHIQHLMKRTKGRELPGTFIPMIISDLFLEQSAPWEAIARSHVDKFWKAAKKFLCHVAAYVADATTSKALSQMIFEPALNQLLGTLNEKTTELLTPHQTPLVEDRKTMRTAPTAPQNRKAGLIKCLQSYEKVDITRWADDSLLRHLSCYM